MLKYGATLGLLLIINLLAGIKFPILRENVYVSNLLVLLIISYVHFSFFRKIKTQPKKYWDFIKDSFQISLIGGVIAVVFFILYIRFIDAAYYTKIISLEVVKLKEQGYDEFAISNAIKIIRATEQLHLKEVSLILSTVTKSFGITLILAPFFVFDPIKLQ